jgi:tRNA threonylcarbamoyl adenosine modification protein YeaZ
MKILALEFSSETRSVALVESGRVAGRAAESGGRSTRAFALIDAVLREAVWEREAIECIAVGLGPGSYTGIRAAIALAQGWQFARDVQALGIGSVECLAAQAHSEGVRGAVHFLIDAQRGEFYCARAELAEEAPRIEPLRIISQEEARSLPERALVVEPALIQLFPNARALCPEAAALGKLASARSDYLSTEKLEPIYLRPAAFIKAPPPRAISSLRS